MPNFISDYVRGRRLVGRDWIESNERFRIEYRRMAFRAPFYRLAIRGLQALHARTADPRQAEAHMRTAYFPRLGMVPEGSYAMGKLLGIREDGAPLHPVAPEDVRLQPPSPAQPPELPEQVRTSTSGTELRRLASFSARLARATSMDELPQMLDEYEHRKAILKQVRRGIEPTGNRLPEGERRFSDGRLKLYGYARYNEIADRPLDRTSYWMMNRTWVRGHLLPNTYQAYIRTQLGNPGGYFGEAFAEYGRGIPGGEDNPAMQAIRVAASAYRAKYATLKHDARVIRRVRVVLVTEALKFARTEARAALAERSSAKPAASHAGSTPVRRIADAAKHKLQTAALHALARIPDLTAAPMPLNWVPPVPVEMREIAKESDVDSALATLQWPEKWRGERVSAATRPGAEHSAPAISIPRLAAVGVAAAQGLSAPGQLREPMETRAVYDHSFREGGALVQNITEAIASKSGEPGAGGRVQPRRRHVLPDLYPSLAVPPPLPEITQQHDNSLELTRALDK